MKNSPKWKVWKCFYRKKISIISHTHNIVTTHQSHLIYYTLLCAVVVDIIQKFLEVKLRHVTRFLQICAYIRCMSIYSEERKCKVVYSNITANRFNGLLLMKIMMVMVVAVMMEVRGKDWVQIHIIEEWNKNHISYHSVPSASNKSRTSFGS